MKRSPVSSIRTAPSPRTASVTSGIGPRRPVEGGRVKLDELEIGRTRAGPRRQARGPARSTRRVCRVRVEPAETARGEHDGPDRK